MGTKVEEATAPITAPDTGRLELAEANSRTVTGYTGSNASEMIRSLREARGTAGKKTDNGGLDEFGGGHRPAAFSLCAFNQAASDSIPSGRRFPIGFVHRFDGLAADIASNENDARPVIVAGPCLQPDRRGGHGVAAG